MTRSASPNGAVEFSYDFPVAGPSTLPPPRRPRTRASSPSSAQSQSSQRTRPRWEASSFDAELEDTDDTPYDAFGYPYPRAGRTRPIPVPAPTRNQWLAPTPSPTYPYGGYPYANDYPPMLMAPAPHWQPSSCESAMSALSAASSSHSHSHDAHKEKHVPAKIRKARRSVDSERPAWDSYDAPSYTPQFVDSPHSSPTLDLDDEEEEAEDEQAGEDAPHQPASHECASLTLRRHWTALSLRVRFGVFRAKRRMRARVMSL
ncbi:hypothetical protein B0H16DRAFT_1729390 [Mycena metata]|uniref:Uncharacterized protein n=1 Tax=Mycena metata TaxID=1033252 RepID=A0AAD7ID32_9AGAR|nr:hypothetical protein B0H16DRAFT_1729390 [Mycena metata]